MSAFGGGPFGQSAPAFGSSAPAFGSSTPAFGSSFGAAPAFGSSTPAFGATPASSSLFASSAPAFGSSFGASNSAFGAPAPSPFGAAAANSSSAFGAPAATPFGAPASTAAPQSAFGSAAAPQQPSANPFGAPASAPSLFGGGAAGAAAPAPFGASTPAFGASSSSLFGAPASTPLFGAQPAPSLFGSGAPGGSSLAPQQPGQSLLGGAGAPGGATIGVNWQETVEYDGNPSTRSKYQAITMMQQFRDRSIEELRLQDYFARQGGQQQQQQQQPQQQQPFGAPQSGSSLFGASSAPAFGQSTPAFGASQFGQSAPAFGGASSGGGLFGGGAGGGAFGAQPSAPGLFGSSGSGFGASQPAFGASQPAFGASTPAFGAPQTDSGFGASTGSAFGTSQFGAPSSGGGLFGGATSAPAFGTPAPTGGGLFGSAAPSTTGGLFGGAQSTSSLFGQSAAAPSGGLFGSAASTPAFGAPTSAPSLFGAASQPAFGTSASQPAFGAAVPQSGSLFGAAPQSTPALGFGAPAAASSGGLFGAQPAPSLFGSGGASAPATGGGFSFGSSATPWSQTPSQQQQPTQPQPFAQPQQQSTPFQSSLGGGGGLFQTPQPPPVYGGPSVQDTLSAITERNGTTVAPPGVSYGTVLANLQRIQKELDEHRRQSDAQQPAANAASKPASAPLSVVVIPPPPLVTLSAPRATPNRWAARDGTPGRTPIRSTAAAAAASVGTPRVSGTPISALQQRRQQQQQPAGTSNALVPATPGTATRQLVPFFSPNQFSGPPRRSGRPSNGVTPLRHGRLLPPPSLGRAGRAGSAAGRDKEADEDDVSGDDSRADRLKRKKKANGVSRRASTGEGDDESVVAGDKAANERGGGGSGEKGSGDRRESREFMWSGARPSTWSLNRDVDAAEQYDAGAYLPVVDKEDYYTEPSVRELAVRDLTELQRVSGFTIGRRGYGYVRWAEPVDVRGLNVAAVVEIERGEVGVFPERGAEQLDAAATVALEGMFAKTKDDMSEAERKKARARYEAKLRKFCGDSKVRFGGYDGERGLWWFDVDSFSS